MATVDTGLAGTPATIVPSGTSRLTTNPALMMAFGPIHPGLHDGPVPDEDVVADLDLSDVVEVQPEGVVHHVDRPVVAEIEQSEMRTFLPRLTYAGSVMFAFGLM